MKGNTMNKMIRRIAFASLLLSTLAASAEETAKKPSPIPQQEVIEAALSGKLEIIEKALAQGYKPDARDPENRTALMYAAFNGQAAIVKILQEAAPTKPGSENPKEQNL